MNKIFNILIVLFLWNSFFAASALAVGEYSTVELTDWLYKPKVLANEAMQVIWTEGPGYNELMLFDGEEKMLTDRCFLGNAIIGEKGDVAWIEDDLSVYVYNGKMTQKISTLSSSNYNIKINKKGNVAWDGYEEFGDRSVFFYNGKVTKKVSLSGNNYIYDLNNKNEIIYIKVESNYANSELFIYDGKVSRKITDNDYAEDMAIISESGKFSWVGLLNDGVELFYGDKKNIYQVTDNENHKLSHVISRKGDLSWIEMGAGSPNNEIYLYSKEEKLKIHENDLEVGGLMFNKAGQLVWQSYFATPECCQWEVFFYDGFQVERLTDNETFDHNVTLSDNGYIAWTHNLGPYIQSGEIHVYDGMDEIVVTHSNPPDIQDLPLRINNDGEIVFKRRDRGTEEESIYLAYPVAGQ